MKMKHKLAVMAAIGLFNLTPNFASAATLNTAVGQANDGLLLNFTGIDWHQNGAAWVQNFIVPNAADNTGTTIPFTLTYQAFATSISTTTPTPNLRIAPPAPGGGTYELTTYSTLNELATCQNADCSQITFAINGPSTWEIYIDNTPDALQSAGTGFKDGTIIASGTWDSQTGGFTAGGPVGTPGAGGSGLANLGGSVDFTNNTYINPDLLGTSFAAVLSFPGSATQFTRPAAFDGTATGANTATDFVLQADGFQDFTEANVPVPSAILLMGSALLGLGGFTKRKRS